MSELILTPNKYFFEQHDIRTYLDEKGNPWWLAHDVCVVLDHANVPQAMTKLDSDEKLLSTQMIAGQKRSVNLVNEAGLFNLILTSRLPKAQEFKRWVTHEVLPEIRKTGSYNQQTHKIPQTYAAALLEAGRLAEENDHLTAQLQIAQPKINGYDTLMASGTAISIGNFAKILGKKTGKTWGQNRLFEWLRIEKFLIGKGGKYNTPYQEFIDRGYFEVIEISIKDGKEIKLQTLLTPAGQAYLLKRLVEHGNDRPVIDRAILAIEYQRHRDKYEGHALTFDRFALAFTELVESGKIKPQ